MIKKFEVDLKLFLDSQNIQTVVVKANSERKAKEIAVAKVTKNFHLYERNVDVVACRLKEEN